jgi:septum formation protein
LQLRRRKLVLASASPQRRELLESACYAFEIVAPAIEETPDAALPPERQAELLAERKAEAVAPRVGAAVVLAADTLVVCEGRVLGKATEAGQAREFLRLVTAHRCAVITGVCVLDTVEGTKQVAHDVSWVQMRPMTEAEIDAYVASCGWQDKAGAYAVQAGGDPFIERIEGSKSNVIGLPLELVARLVPRTFHEHLAWLRRDMLERHRGLIINGADFRFPISDFRFQGPEAPARSALSLSGNRQSAIGNWQSVAPRFENPGAPLEVEIGPGKDDFVVRAALASPGTNFLAIERLRERVDKLCGKIKRAEARNVRVFFGGANAVEAILGPGQAQAFYIHFPDPWPKRRHAKHRLLQPWFAAVLAERLAPGGRLNIVTDARPYAEEILAALEATPGLANRLGKGAWANELPGYHQSVYERKRRAAGCMIYYLLFERTTSTKDRR